MTVTLDINVLLDVFQQRQPHFPESSRVVDMVVGGSLVGILPSHGLTTLYYLVRKHGTRSGAEAAMDQVLKHFQIRGLDQAEWDQARKLTMEDFEDAAVAMVAQTSGSAYVITRNTNDFGSSPVRAISPADFLAMLAAT